MKLLKNESYELKLHAYARKLQSLWKIKKARQQIIKMKKQRLELNKFKAVILVQCMWRKRKARNYLTHLRDLRIGNKLKKELEIKKNKAREKIMWFLLLFISKIRTRNAIMTAHLHSFHIHIKSGHNLLGGNVSGTSDPYIKIVGSRLVLYPGQKHYSAAARKNGFPKPQGLSKTICTANTQYIDNTLNPIWDTKLILSGLYGTDSIIFNVYDKDTFGVDKFLGQGEIELMNYPQLFNNLNKSEELIIENLELQQSLIRIHDDKGNVLPIHDAMPIGKKCSRGSLQLTIRISTITRSMCGWIYKFSSSIIPGLPRTFKRRWLVLSDDSLQYYDDMFTLNDPRYIIACKDVSLIEQTIDETTGILDTVTIAFQRDSWYLKFIEEDSQFIRQRWLSKINQACYNLGYRSKDTQSRLASFPILHNVRQLVSKNITNPDNIDVTNLPLVPDIISNNNSNDKLITPQRRNSNPNTPNDSNENIKTKRRTSIFSNVLGL